MPTVEAFILLIKFGEASEEKDDAFLLYQTFFSDSTSELQKCSVLNLKFITKLCFYTIKQEQGSPRIFV